MRKPNYSMERKDRERAKQAKAAAKLEKRAAKGTEGREPDGSEPGEQIVGPDSDKAKPGG